MYKTEFYSNHGELLGRGFDRMPLFAIHVLDRPGALPLRLEQSAAHRAYVETECDHGLSIVMSGPLQSDDGEIMTGSLFVIDAPDRARVEAFVKADPFSQSGVWGEVKIARFHRRTG
jgi:uncharacterized protein YciI